MYSEFGGIAFLSKRYAVLKKYLGITIATVNTFTFYITLFYVNKLINDGRSYVLQMISMYLNITEYKILCRFSYSYYCTPLYQTVTLILD